MTHTNTNIERTFKRNKHDEEVRRDYKRDKERGKFKRNLDRKRKRFEREVE